MRERTGDVVERNARTPPANRIKGVKNLPVPGRRITITGRGGPRRQRPSNGATFEGASHRVPAIYFLGARANKNDARPYPGAQIMEPYDVLKAAENGRCAIRRGDLAAAERWFRIAERAARIAHHLTAAAAAEARAHPRWERNPV